MKASNDGHNRLRLGRWKEGSLLHLHSERERERDRKREESLVPTFPKSFLSFLNKMEKIRKKENGGERILLKKSHE
jgi:hypothetical protein